jgi:hypothetical protein
MIYWPPFQLYSTSPSMCRLPVKLFTETPNTATGRV